MNLREYLRLDFAIHLRYLLTKDRCEWCGSQEDLNLHHVDRFHNLLIETLEELKVNELSNIDDYPKEVLLLIRDKMISKQLRIEYKTLCEKCHKKLHSIESKSDAYKENVYNPYGDYFFLNIDSISSLNTQYAFRFLYLCCFAGYKNDLVYGNAKNGYSQMNIKDLQEVLKLSTRETARTKKIFIENNLIQLDQNNNLIIDKNIMYKGFKPNGSIQYIRFFSDFTKNLYEELLPATHTTIGRIFKIIPYISENNCVVDNQKPLKSVNVCKVLGYKNNTTTKTRVFLKYNILINKENCYFVNTNFIYNGLLNKNLKKLSSYLQ